MSPERLDRALTLRGLARSRTQAQVLLRDGLVRVDGEPVTRASHPVGPEDVVTVVHDPGAGGAAAWIARGWVGRGAVKLDHALTTWAGGGLSARDRRCLDVGASTGGFTQVLLERGARQVLALDVGHGQLDPQLGTDPRVVDLPGTHVLDVSAEDLDGPVDLVVVDVSFISLRQVLPVLPALCRPGADLVLLVKPQFEVGRAALGSTGVVRSVEQRAQVLADLEALARDLGLAPGGWCRSPVTGGSGNTEYLLWLHRPGPDMMDWGLAPAETDRLRRALREEESL